MCSAIESTLFRLLGVGAQRQLPFLAGGTRRETRLCMRWKAESFQKKTADHYAAKGKRFRGLRSNWQLGEGCGARQDAPDSLVLNKRTVGTKAQVPIK